jgi:PIN domain nuclease of toxin-antitoxin system
LRFLLDTHLLIWASSVSSRLTPEARGLITDPENEIMFSVISLWEIAIKSALGRSDFDIDPHILRRVLIDNEYKELAFLSDHALMVTTLPNIHSDPFDRALLAQARAEGIILLSSDRQIQRYGGGVKLV